MNIGIYKITNPKGKIYIGQSTNIDKRFKYYNRLECKGQPKIYNSLKKYGPENHIFEVVEECSLELLDEREIYWMSYYNVLNFGLNIKEGGLGGKHSQETKNKISEKLKGKIMSNETRLKIYTPGRSINISNKIKGLKRSEETKEKISKSNKGKSRNKGISKSEEFKQLARIRQLGNKHSQEHIDNFKKSMVGKNDKPIICITTGEIFDSIKEASNILNILPSSIDNILSGKAKFTRKSKLTFSYYNN